MRILANVARVLLALVAALLVWGTFEPYMIEVEEHEVALTALPAAWDGRRIALVADLQVGMWMGNTSTIERIVRRIVREEPAAALIAGDFVYHPAGRPGLARRAARLLEPLTEAGIPTYAVLGNHDYAMPTNKVPRNDEAAFGVRAALEEVGIRVLENEAVPLPLTSGSPGESLYLAGVGPHVPGLDRPDLALAEVPDAAARLLLMHHPNTFGAVAPGTAPLAVAAHTHGGQFRIPFTPEWTWMTYTTSDEVHADGFAEGFGAEGNLLYVNRGIGFSLLPLRLNCPPELTLFTLGPA